MDGLITIANFDMLAKIIFFFFFSSQNSVKLFPVVDLLGRFRKT